MLSVIGISALIGLGSVSLTFLQYKTLKKRLMEILIACEVFTNNPSGKLLPKIVKQIKTDYGHKFLISLPYGLSSEEVIKTKWKPIAEALKKEISIEYDDYLIINIYKNPTPKRIEWSEELCEYQSEKM